MATPIDYARAFERNCPGVRMNIEEIQELTRLFNVCATEAREKAQLSLIEQLQAQKGNKG